MKKDFATIEFDNVILEEIDVNMILMLSKSLLMVVFIGYVDRKYNRGS